MTTNKLSNNLTNNLNALMEHLHVGAVQLTRATGVPLSTIKNIRKQKNMNPTIETLLPLANYFSISLDELLMGDAIRSLEVGRSDNSCSVASNKLPILQWDNTLVQPFNVKSKEIIYSEKKCSEQSFALKVEDDIGLFSAPGLFLVDPELAAHHLDYVLVQKKDVSKPFVRQFICDGEFQYLKSMTVTDKLTAFDESYRLLGVIIEYRQTIRRQDAKKIFLEVA